MTTSTAPGRQAREPLLTRAFVLLAVAELLYFTADGVAIYALPVLVTGPVGSNAAGAGLAFGAFALSALVLRPFAGRLADSRGRRPLLVAGALLCAVGMLGTAHVSSLAAVVALRLLLGVAEAAFFVASFAAVADLAPASRLGEAMSYNSLGLYLGLAFGPPLGEVLVRTAGIGTAWYAAGGLAVIAALAALALPETLRPAEGDDGAARRGLIHWPTVPVALGFLTSIVAIGCFLAFAALHAEAVGLAGASVPLLLYGVVVVGCRIAFARLPDRVPPLALAGSALAAMAAGLAVLAAWPTPAGLLAGSALLAVGVAFSTPAFVAAALAGVRPGERGAAAGTLTAAIDLGLGAGPILLGLVAGSAGIPVALGVSAVVALAGGAWTVRLGARRAARRLGEAEPQFGT